jgi:hypothetical protein
MKGSEMSVIMQADFGFKCYKNMLGPRCLYRFMEEQCNNLTDY